MRDFCSEAEVRTSRSGGKGGQNVNKLETKVQLFFRISTSKMLNEQEKNLLTERLSHKINQDGSITIVSEKERSQLLNKLNACEKLNKLIIKGLAPVKKRKKTKPSLATIEKRLREKRIKSERKSLRRDSAEE